jgi:predicted small metal-binding protein
VYPGYVCGMRVLDCECGKTLQAANDDDLVRAVQDHVEADHPGMEMSGDQARELVSSQAYDAQDS